jgi:UDP-2-acetamido-3-amino-2,3-dideoxy-glucuronate N-acetyltransferase
VLRLELTVVCGITIGEFAFISAGALVNKDVPAYALMVGVSAKQISWMIEYGEKLDLSVSGNAEATCCYTGQTYHLKGNKLTIGNE